MRNRFAYYIDNKKEFLDKLVLWTKNYDHSCVLNSNSPNEFMPQHYKDYDFLCAIGLNQLCIADEDSFEKIKAFHNRNKDWMFGYFSYDLKNETDNLASRNIDFLKFPKLYFFIPEHVIYLNTEGLFVETFSNKEEIDNIVSNIHQQQIEQESFGNLQMQKRETKRKYLAKIKQIKSHIKRGDIYEMNYCQEFFAENAVLNPEALYLRLNKKTQAPFSAFLQLSDKYLICTSPERFLKKENQQLISQPIKGTRKRSAQTLKDLQLKAALLNSEKDKSENVMITDLVRNDLSKFATKASVKVEELFGVYSFEQVHQMISTISAELSEKVHFIDAIKGAFPMGSMTGAPKKKAMELIEQFECNKRGLFSGSVGYIKPNSDFDFNVVIRSVLYNATNKYFSVMAGGAITAKSNPEEEYEECIVKVKAILDVVSNQKAMAL